MIQDICSDCGRDYEAHDTGPCYQMRERLENERRAGEIVDLFSRYVNQGRSATAVVNSLKHEHRTLQQSMTEVMLQWFVHLASLGPNEYDPRNEMSVRVAKAIMPALEEHGVVYTRNGEVKASLPTI